MDVLSNPAAGRTLFLAAVIFLGFAVAALMGMAVGADAIKTIILLVVVIAVVWWISMARTGWWLLVPAMAGIGGYFYFGYKIYTNEMALLACVIPLALARAVRAPGMLQHRAQGLPLAMYLLSGYLIAHWVVSNVYNKLNGQAGYGNVSRAYLNALWVIFFVILFWRYGSTKYLRIALLLSYLAAFARVIVGLGFYFSDSFGYIPVINYVLPGSTHTRGADLRASALALACLALVYFLLKRGFLKRCFHLTMFLLSCAILPFGSGRTVMVLAGLMPIFAALIYRRIIPLLLSIAAIAAGIFIINFQPSLLDSAPFTVQRASSIFMLEKGAAERYGQASGSDEWHQRLREVGFKKWTQSWNTFLFGTGIRPYDSAVAESIAGYTTMEDLLESSSKVGAYESGWWTVIAVTGLVGLILYLAVILYLLRRLTPILFRERIRDHRHAFAFLAVTSMVIWLGLGWTNGGFPSGELMAGFLALLAFQDDKRLQVHLPVKEGAKMLAPIPALAATAAR